MHAVALSSRPPRTDCSDVQGPSWSSGCALAGPGNLALLTRARAPEPPGEVCGHHIGPPRAAGMGRDGFHGVPQPSLWSSPLFQAKLGPRPLPT